MLADQCMLKVMARGRPHSKDKTECT